MKLLLNGQLIDSKEAVISAFDHGFLYGMGLFETFRTYRGGAFLLERHAARLQAGCRMLGIAYMPDPMRIQREIDRLLAANELTDGYIRWSLSAGEGAIGLPAELYHEPTEIVYIKPLPADDPKTRSAKSLVLLDTLRSTPETPVRLKSFHYMNNIVAKRELTASGAPTGAEGLFLNARGEVVEGMVSNVFWIRGGELYTPAIETGLLPGITREFVIELAVESGLQVHEGLYAPEALWQADEVFLTNSVQEIVPVAQLIDRQGRVHALAGEAVLTRRLMAQYRMHAERNGS